MASNEIVRQGYNGIFVDVLEFYTYEGELIHSEGTRDAVNNAQKALYEQKQGTQRK